MSNALSVPHYPQLADGYCLPACVQMVLAYWGMTRSQRRLSRQLQTVPGAGTPGSNLLRLAGRTLEVYYGSGDLPDLRAALAQRIPPIVLVNTKEFPHWTFETLHAVVVTALDDTQVLINDPGRAQGGSSVSLGDFYLAWDEMANLYATIRKK